MDEQQKKQALRMIPYGVHVIGLKGYNHVGGYTGSWIMQCSFHPPMVAIGVKRDGIGPGLLDQGKVFSVNFLGVDHASTADYFFNPPEQENGRLGSMPFSTGQTGAPILEDAIAYLECEVLRMLDEHGDHLIYVGKVVNAKVHKEEPPLMMEDTPWHYGG